MLVSPRGRNKTIERDLPVVICDVSGSAENAVTSGSGLNPVISRRRGWYKPRRFEEYSYSVISRSGINTVISRSEATRNLSFPLSRRFFLKDFSLRFPPVEMTEGGGRKDGKGLDEMTRRDGHKPRHFGEARVV
jgi:hypothetical protein